MHADHVEMLTETGTAHVEGFFRAQKLQRSKEKKISFLTFIKQLTSTVLREI